MSFFDPITSPGMWTDQEAETSLGRQDPGWQKQHGYEWWTAQVFNGATGGKKDRSLTRAKEVGMHAGVWGVFYDQARFFQDGKAFAEQALHVGAEFLIVDGEDSTKFTRVNRGCKPIIDGLRAGGWNGPVHWTQMGAPSNPRTATNPNGNDFACDEQSFLETGGGVLPQEYANESPEYDPALCYAYWLACGVPANRLNHLIAMYVGRAGRIDGKGWAALLQAAKIGRNFSVYMAEMLEPLDAEGLDAQTKLPVPAIPPPTPPPPIPEPGAIRTDMSATAHKWLDPYMKLLPPKAQTTSVIRLADRLLRLTGTQQADFNEQLLIDELDRVGSPRS